MNIENITHHYAIAALWSSIDDNGEALDFDHDLADISPDTLQSMRDDVASFVEAARPLLIQSGLDDGQIGHDFWLTRNHHGAGFWDRNLGEAGEQLTAISHRFGDVFLYIGDDDQIHS